MIGLFYHHKDVIYNNCMIELTIPGRGTVQLEHLVCDVNGTLAVDGKLIAGVAQALHGLRDRLAIHLVTADTHGKQAIIDQQLDLTAVRLTPGDESGQKAAYVRRLGAASVVALGQGANDAGMLSAAAIGIATMSPEGLAVETLLSADLVVSDILAAFELLEKPIRLVATLRI
jgi:P-type E1-E2 ATPase